MPINQELELFDDQGRLLGGFIHDLSSVDASEITQGHLFLAEAVIFRLYRIYERLVRSAFLHYCVTAETIAGAEVKSKLKCEDWEMAENILKSGNKFLDWGNVVSVKKLAGFVFENGFPITEMLSPIHGHLIDLQRFRNFIAHDSVEAEKGFKKSRGQYINVGDAMPDNVGGLALYRRSSRGEISIQILHDRVSSLSAILNDI